jgi:hypothetical protein
MTRGNLSRKAISTRGLVRIRIFLPNQIDDSAVRVLTRATAIEDDDAATAKVNPPSPSINNTHIYNKCSLSE